MVLISNKRERLIKKIHTFIQSSIIGITIPIPKQLSDNELIILNDFIEYINSKPQNLEELHEKKNEIIEMMMRHKQLEEQY